MNDFKIAPLVQNLLFASKVFRLAVLANSRASNSNFYCEVDSKHFKILVAILMLEIFREVELSIHHSRQIV